MILPCPKCKTKIEITAAHLTGSAVAVCTRCRTPLKIRLSLESSGGEPKSAASPAPPSQAPSGSGAKSVLIALDGEITRELVRDILNDGGFKTIESVDGKDVMALLRGHRPLAALIDVGLSEVLGFQLCEQIKNDPDLRGTVVILVASIYDKSKYRRRPDQLYGAEDFIERQRLPDDLLETLKRHLSRGKQNASPRPAAAPPVEREPVRAKPAETVRSPVPEAPSPAAAPAGATPEQEAAKRLARIIVADIALYNKKEVEEGIKNGTLREVLKEQLTEGRRHYDSRVSEEVRADRDFYNEALEDFIQKKKRML